MNNKIFKLFFLIIILLSFIKVDADELYIKLINWGGSGSDYFRDVDGTSDGGYIVVGYTSSKEVGDLVNNGSSDAIIVKYDSNDDVEWQKNYGGSSSDLFLSVTETSDGGYVAVGYICSTDIEGITSHGGKEDGIIVKFDNNGNVLWQQSYGGNSYDYFYDVVETSDGGYVVVGGTISTDISGIINSGKNDGIIVKYDSDGNIVWQQSYGGNSYDEFANVVANSDGSCTVVGSIYSNDIDGINNNGGYDAIMIKYDIDGNILWQQNYGGNKLDYFYGVIETSDGGHVAVGYVSSTDIDGITNNGSAEAVIVKYDSDGNVLWQQSWGGRSEEMFYGVVENSSGEILAIGEVSSTNIDGITIYGDEDAIVAKYDSDGNMLWQQNYGGSKDDVFNNIGLTTSGDIIVVGETSSGDIEGLTSFYLGDALILKLSTASDDVSFIKNYNCLIVIGICLIALVMILFIIFSKKKKLN